MITHKATISSLSSEFLSIVGFSFCQIYLQAKDLLILEIENDENTLFIEFSVSSPYDRILIRDKHTRAKANTKDLFGVLLGEVITNVSQVEDDRILSISTHQHNLYFKLFGHKQSDLLITTKKNKIIHSLNNLDLIGIKFKYEAGEQREVNDFDDATPLLDVLLQSKYYFGKYYAKKFFSDSEYTADNLLKDVDKTKLTEELERFYYQLAKSKKSFIYKLQEYKYLFSLIKLDGYELFRECSSISEGIRTKFVQEISKKRIFEFKKLASNKLLRLIEKDKKAILQIEKLSDGLEESEQYKHYAELLISQTNPKEKLGKKAEIIDWDGSRIVIPLDERLNLIDNSQKYFKKASSILKERAFAKSKLIELNRRLVSNKELIQQIADNDDLKDLENLLFEKRKLLGNLVEKRKSEMEEDKFKKYELSEGYTLYVGKNAKNNDELTLRFAKPNDIWLHARGVSGSHCVIRVDGKLPSKGIIKEAATIAAYYSKAKSSHLVPVAYTQKKYVSKPKGANPGAVVIRREEVILVEPFTPE